MAAADLQQLAEIQADMARRQMMAVAALPVDVDALSRVLRDVKQGVEDEWYVVRRAYERNDPQALATLRIMERFSEQVRVSIGHLWTVGSDAKALRDHTTTFARTMAELAGDPRDGIELRADALATFHRFDDRITKLIGDDGALAGALDSRSMCGVPALLAELQQLQRLGVRSAFDWSDRLQRVAHQLRQQLSDSAEIHHASRAGMKMSLMLLERAHEVGRNGPEVEGPGLG